MKRLLVILSVTSLCACEHFIDDISLEKESLEKKSPEEVVEGVASADTSVYMSGMEYPQGYDWKRDTAYGEVNCTLFLMKNGERILTRPVGYKETAASDRDMHRIVKGSLYEDYARDGETIVRKNGELLWKWNGNLMINDMDVCNGDIYTLASPRRGKGYTLYENGEAILESRTGSPVSKLKSDNGTVYFTVLEDDGNWAIVQENKSETIGCDGWVIKQAELRDGQMSAVCEDHGTVVLFENGAKELINPSLRFNSLDVALIISGDIILAGDVTDIFTRQNCFCIMSRDRVTRYGKYDVKFISFCANDRDVCILAYLPESGTYAILHEGDILTIPQGYVPAPGGAMALVGSKVYVSVTKDGKAAIWENGIITDYPFNGYIDNINLITQ